MTALRIASIVAKQVIRTGRGIDCTFLDFTSARPLQLCHGSWRFCSSVGPAAKQEGGYRKRQRVCDFLLQHKRVGSLRLLDGVVFIIPASKSELGFLSADLDEQTLRKFLMQECGFKSSEVPEMKVVKALPCDKQSHCPFMLQHVIDSLFRSLDTDGNGSISILEFERFCHDYGFYGDDDNELRCVFKDADRQKLRSFGGNELDISEFKELLFNTGFIEARVGWEANAGGAYFVDNRIVDVVLKNWFSRYDVDGDGCIDFKEYCRLVADYQLPYAVSRQSFDKLDLNGDGIIDIDEFKLLMMDAKILATGGAISRKADHEGLQKAWRALESSQVFLPPSRVYSSATNLPPQDNNVIRFVCISDTHGQHRHLTDKIPAGDVLLHAGDFSMSGEMREFADFGEWLRDLPFALKVLTAGNHDVTLDVDYELNEHPSVVDEAKSLLLQKSGGSTVLLQDEIVKYKGICIYGSPWQPAFGSWAFNLQRGESLSSKWRKIPGDVDVLLVHGPPMGRGDLTANKHVGCADLLREIQSRVRPTFCVAGHIHSAGSCFDGVTHYVNASSCNEDYDCVNYPQVFDIPMR